MHIFEWQNRVWNKWKRLLSVILLMKKDVPSHYGNPVKRLMISLSTFSENKLICDVARFIGRHDQETTPLSELFEIILVFFILFNINRTQRFHSRWDLCNSFWQVALNCKGRCESPHLCYRIIWKSFWKFVIARINISRVMLYCSLCFEFSAQLIFFLWKKIRLTVWTLFWKPHILSWFLSFFMNFYIFNKHFTRPLHDINLLIYMHTLLKNTFPLFKEIAKCFLYIMCTLNFKFVNFTY